MCGPFIPGEVEFAISVYKKRITELESRLKDAEETLNLIRIHAQELIDECCDQEIGIRSCDNYGCSSIRELAFPTNDYFDNYKEKK